MSELRGYQQDLLESVHRLLDAPDARVMLQLPTGGGKTRIAGDLLLRWLKDGRKAVWLTHRRELAAQTEGMLQQDGVTATSNMRWEPHTNAPTLVNGVVILMAQTVSRRTAVAEVWNGYDARDLMIIDEAHHATADGWARAMRQWPGSVLGMTATPWRLSQKEGFDHLFEELVCGPQVAALQSDGWLCNARALSLPEDEMIQGGQLDYTGDYSEPGIERANENRDVWTAGALRFWQKRGENRQTVIYAVSVRHANNLVAVFNDAGIPAGALLAETPDAERAELIGKFRNGDLKALINVAVATEGFDLPDAACVLLTRPTMSLALYLQMVGRGLRHKPDDGDCVVLDLAGNSLRHGLPEEDREWSLQARGEQPPGDAPLIRCEKCEALSPAASHQCGNCGWAFGESCRRCGAWRAWKRWTRKDACGQDHDPVCDLCHYDAHVQGRLPVTEELKELAVLQEDDELSPYRNPYLKDLLEEERRRISGASDERRDDLRRSVEQMEFDLKDDERVYHRFEQYRDSLPHDQRPFSRRQNANLYVEWESNLETELEGWKEELARLEAQSVDGRLVLNNVRERLLRLLEAEAREASLVRRQPAQVWAPQQWPVRNSVTEPGESMTFTQLAEWIRTSYTKDVRPLRFRDHMGHEIAVNSWSGLFRETAEWLVRKGFLTKGRCPIGVGEMSNKYLVHTEPVHLNQNKFRQPQRLSNGLWLDPQQGGGDRIARSCILLIQKLGQDPDQFHVQLSQLSAAGLDRSAPTLMVKPQPLSADSAVTGLPGPGEWLNFTQLAEWIRASYTAETRPQSFRDTLGNELAVSSWSGLLRETAERLIQEGAMPENKYPVLAGGMSDKYLVHAEPIHPNRQNFRNPKKLSNGLWLNTQLGGGDRVASMCVKLVEECGRDPEQFQVQLYQANEAGTIQRVRDRISAFQPPSAGSPVTGSPGPGEWMTFPQLAEQGTALLHRETSTWPQRLRDPRGNEVYVNRWIGFLREVAEWFIREGLLTKEKCPVVVGGMHERCLINSEPVHTGGKPFRRVIRLSNELYLEGNLYSRDIARHCAPMVEKFGKDPGQFHVQLSN